MVSIAIKNNSVKKGAKAESSNSGKAKLSFELLNVEVLNFIVSVIVLAVVVYYLPSGSGESGADLAQLDANCKSLCGSLESQGYEYSGVDKTGSCFCTQEATIPDFANNRTLTAKIKREIGVISGLEVKSGIGQQPIQIS